MYKDSYVFTCRWLGSESGKLQNLSNVSSSLLTSQVGTGNLLGQNPKIPDWPQLHGLVECHLHGGPASWGWKLKHLATHRPFVPRLRQGQHLGPQSLVGSKDDSNKDQACKGWSQVFHPEARARHPIMPFRRLTQPISGCPYIRWPGHLIPNSKWQSSPSPACTLIKETKSKYLKISGGCFFLFVYFFYFYFLAYKLAKVRALYYSDLWAKTPTVLFSSISNMY